MNRNSSIPFCTLKLLTCYFTVPFFKSRTKLESIQYGQILLMLLKHHLYIVERTVNEIIGVKKILDDNLMKITAKKENK